MRACKHGCDVSDLHVFLRIIFKSNRALFPCLQSLVLTLGGLGEFSKLCKPSTTSRVFITVSNSPNPPRVLMKLCKHGKSVLLLIHNTVSPIGSADHLLFLFSFIFAYFQEELSPVQNALETMESTNKQLRSLIGRYKVDPNLNINPLSMKLGGIIDAAVMGGVSNFEKVSV